MTTRVDFYQLSRDPVERVAAMLAGKAYAGGQRLLIVAREHAARTALDTALWTVQPASFLPHAMDGGADAADEPILIAADCDRAPLANHAPLCLIADGEWRDAALAFERVFFLFGNDRIDDARAAWRHLAKQDCAAPHYWRQNSEGRWTEGP